MDLPGTIIRLISKFRRDLGAKDSAGNNGQLTQNNEKHETLVTKR